jgi:Neutral/alkaline non-lysosomal ceramidase, N-terminal
MWGAATHDRATGVHRPLYATALVFQALQPTSPESGRIIMVAVDHCLLHGKEMDSLLQYVATRCKLPKDELIVTFSHTHSAGLMGLDRSSLPGGELIPAYLKGLADSIASIVWEAVSRTQPVTISYGIGRSNLGANRDFWDEETKQFVCGFNPNGASDDTVVVARVCDATGKVTATVVNYACHPTTLAWQNTLISPDYPGTTREVVEQVTGGICVFLQGASGDIGPRDGYVADVHTAERNGRILGYAALSALESLAPPATTFQYTGPVVSGATLGTWSHVPLDDETRAKCARWQLKRFVVELPYRSDLPTLAETRAEQERWQQVENESHRAGDHALARDARAMTERMTRIVARLNNLPAGKAFPMPVALWRAGDACWLTVECEHYNLLQRSLRDRFPNNPIVLATLANGARATYLPTRASFGHGIYQESIALTAPGSLENFIETVAAQIGEMLCQP